MHRFSSKHVAWYAHVYRSGMAGAPGCCIAPTRAGEGARSMAIGFNSFRFQRIQVVPGCQNSDVQTARCTCM